MGAVGEIAGWAFCDRGVLLQKGTNTRVASVPLEQPAQPLIIGVAGGVKKAEAILAALRGKLITGLITDEVAYRTDRYSGNRCKKPTQISVIVKLGFEQYRCIASSFEIPVGW